MRIAFYAPLKAPDHPVPSGDRRMARLLTAALRQAGHDVIPASGLRAYEGRGDTAAQDAIRTQAGAEVGRIVDSLDVDLWFTYHLYHKAPDWIGPAVCRAKGIPYWVAEASFAPKQNTGPWASGHAAVEQALKQAAGVFQLNPEDRDCIAPLLPPAARIVDLPPFLDIRPFMAEPPAKRALADRFDLPADTPWLITVAMMRAGDKARSYRLLAEATKSLGTNDYAHLIVGDGAAAADIREAFASDTRARFLGQLPEETVHALLGAADLFAWPGLNEAYGLAILEAQAAGLPVVSAARPGIANMVRDGETGMLAAEGDAAAFAAALAALLDNPDRRRAMGRAAADRVRARHSQEAAAATLDRELCR